VSVVIAPVAPSVAFFTDSYLEINGVARTSRKLEEFARRTNRRFLCVHGASSRTQTAHERGIRLPLRRGLTSFHLERDLQFDVNLWRYTGKVLKEVSGFGANVIHVTSPGDVGLLGAYIANKLGIPLVASWHTNVHEYAKCRLQSLLRFLPDRWERGVAQLAEIQALRMIVRFYKAAEVILAPNLELLRMLESETGKPAYLMQRGVETDQFSPRKRTRQENRIFRIGFVGRLSPEKNVQFLAKLERGLTEKGFNNFSIVVVGDGAERRWLERNLTRAEFTGVLLNDSLAEAYANMDVFAFPSRTDTFGNVILEALASGVPPIVMNSGGPKYLVDHGISGFVSRNEEEFIDFVSHLMSSPDQHRNMREQARTAALKRSWDCVFEEVYRAYETAINRNHKEVA
jgi:glycosyltransferase involved in cell wall biosynthesis